MVQISDIKKGAQFKATNGIVWIIDSVEGNRVRTSMSHGAKGNYCDDINEVVSFLNEEGAVFYRSEADKVRDQIIEALGEYEGDDFLINDELIDFIEQINLNQYNQ